MIYGHVKDILSLFQLSPLSARNERSQLCPLNVMLVGLYYFISCHSIPLFQNPTHYAPVFYDATQLIAPPAIHLHTITSLSDTFCESEF